GDALGHHHCLSPRAIRLVPAQPMVLQQLFDHSSPPSARIRLSVKQLAPCSAALTWRLAKPHSPRPQPRRTPSPAGTGARAAHSALSICTSSTPAPASSASTSPPRNRAREPPASAPRDRWVTGGSLP